MNKLLTTALLIFLISGFFPVVSIAQEAGHYTCYRASSPIVTDGILNEPDWARAEWSHDFVDITGDPKLKPGLQTRIKLLWDDENIYIAAELKEPHVWAKVQKKDDVVFQDNDFEIFLDPDGNGTNYYEIEVNALGTIWDLMLTRSYKNGGKPLSDWDLKGLKTGIHIRGSFNDASKPDTSWTVEMALPIAGLMEGKKAGSKPAEGVQWKVNFSRVEWQIDVDNSSCIKKPDPLTGKPLPEQNWVWSPMGEVNMHIPSRWGRLEFSSEAVNAEALKFKNEKQRQVFQVWFWMGAHADWTSKEWDSVLNGFQSAGVHGILTQADPSTLRKLIPIAQKHGIVVEKWFVAMMNNDKDLIKSHPEWFVISREGKSCISDPAYVGYYRFLCPSNPEVIKYIKKRLDEYLDIAGLEGIHLDYIRYPDVILPKALQPVYGIVQDREYPAYDYCYCKVCRDNFQLLTGRDPVSMGHPENDTAWRNFRYRQLNSFIQELSVYCHQEKKSLSAAVFPGPSLSKQLVRQEWDQWPLDAFMPMLYRNFYFGNLDWIRAETAEGVKALHAGNFLYSGLYVPSLTPRELRTAINKSLEGGANGICLFNYEAMSVDHWKALEECLGSSRK